MNPVVPKTRPMLDAVGVAATDVVMNLFIFFLIAFSLLATFEKKKTIEERQRAEERRQIEAALAAGANEQALALGLPSSTSAGATPSGALIVTLQPDGAFLVDDRVVASAQLDAALALAMQERKRPVVLRARRALSLGDAVAALDRIWAAGPESVSVATLEPQEGSAAREGKP